MLFQVEVVGDVFEPDQRLLDVGGRGIAIEVLVPGTLEALALILGEAHAPLRLRRERRGATLGGIGDWAWCTSPRRCAAGYTPCVDAHAARPLPRRRTPNARRPASKVPP